jgi:hypothetical protein
MSAVRDRFVRRSTGVACDSGRHRYAIVHRESGRVAGYVAPWAADFALNKRRIWNAYTAAPDVEDAAINGTDEWIEVAILAVLDPTCCRPPDHRGATMDTLKPDEAGSRVKFPEAWEFYDWLVSVTRVDEMTP